MRVFISHKRQDQVIALRVQQRLRGTHQIDCYLDVIDPGLDQHGEDLAKYLRSQMGNCTHLIAVVSGATVHSAWVPWEVGVATEKELPLATYSDGTRPMEFLEKWPYMMTMLDLDKYAAASKAANQVFENRSQMVGVPVARSEALRHFYANLRSTLNQ